MKPIHLYIGVLAISLIGAGVAVASPPLPAIDQTSSADHQAIEALLASYTRCVTEHDEAGFRALLLDEKIPFAAVADRRHPTAHPTCADTKIFGKLSSSVASGIKRSSITFVSNNMAHWRRSHSTS